jgi:ABC-type multidrug transport system fused ATPase/permease subunit
VQKDLLSATPAAAGNATVLEPETDLFSTSIDLASISFSYQGAETKALDEVDLSIRRGEMLAIVGESGSGKSTLVDVLLGLLEPTSGHIWIDGSLALPKDWHRHVGVVSQSVILLDASVRDNVAFGLGSHADDKRVLDALDLAQLTDWVGKLPQGLDTMVGESGKMVSGGERQRIAVARSLYRNPDLLVLDEATSAVDGATEAALIEGLTRLQDGPTTIVVSHRVAPIRAADRIVLMDRGRVVATGRYEELIADNDEFRNLVGL